MILFCIFILIPLVTTKQYDGPSYRSSVMEGDKPILRMNSELGGYASDDEDSDGLRNPIRAKKDPEMVSDLSMLIGWLIENFGYDLAPPQARRYKDDYTQKFDQKKKALRLNINEVPDHPEISDPAENHKKLTSLSKIAAKKPQRASDTSQSQTGEPSWKTDLKEFIKDLITRFGQEDLARYTKPVINSIQKKHDVTITDIDVDEYGEILINFIPKDKMQKPEPKALRYRTPEDDEETGKLLYQPRL